MSKQDVLDEIIEILIKLAMKDGISINGNRNRLNNKQNKLNPRGENENGATTSAGYWK